MKRYLAELIGTFALVFCGTGAMVINEVTGGEVTHVGIGITFGMIVMAMIYTFGKTSGAHINPAVTLAFACTDRFDKKDTVGYIIAQLLGAFLASVVLALLFPTSIKLGATIPAGSWHQSFILEIILTYFLMLVIIFVSQNKETRHMTGIAVGAVVMLEAIFAGPITGASMNPARSIAPAIISGNITHLWLYILAPIIGAVLASYTWIYMKED
ncbi:MAG: aquaporin NIP [Saprospiraceae bacterium]|jgi:aquaporin Z